MRRPLPLLALLLLVPLPALAADAHSASEPTARTHVALGPFSGAPADVHARAIAWTLQGPAPAASVAPLGLDEAALALLALHGAAAPDAMLALAAAPPAVRHDLARVFAAFLAFDLAAQGLPDPHAAPGVLAARQALFEATLALEDTLRAAGPLPIVVDASPAFTLDLAGGSSRYPSDVSLQIDVGGDDLYLNRAGGGGAAEGTPLEFCDPAPPVPSPVAAGYVADLAGNDRYVSHRRCGINGGGMAGAGFLYDAAGDDVYATGQGGVNGGAFAGGVGFLYDAGGDDLYDAQVTHDTYAYGANGAASEGSLGLLVDVEGHDEYRAGQEGANGGGYVGAVGMLLDGAGDDIYSATAFAVNGAGWFARGLLWDGSGNDEYLVLGCCSARDPIHEPTDNGGGMLGSGCLYDGDGHDRYLQAGREAWDERVVPKGEAGAQVDDVARADESC